MKNSTILLLLKEIYQMDKGLNLLDFLLNLLFPLLLHLAMPLAMLLLSLLTRGP